MENNIKEELKNLELVAPRTLTSILSLVLFVFFAFNFSYASAERKKVKVIAMTQIVQHPSLDSARKAILYELKINGFELGKNIKLIEQNAQGNITNAVLIAKNFASLAPDVIVAISTISAQTVLAASKDNDIPIIFLSYRPARLRAC